MQGRVNTRLSENPLRFRAGHRAFVHNRQERSVLLSPFQAEPCAEDDDCD